MLIYEDRSLTVTTIPLRHRMPCCGFLFAEKRCPNHIIREMVDFYQVPVYELNRIKNGADYVTSEGKTVSNNLLTRTSAPSARYEDENVLLQEASAIFPDTQLAKETLCVSV